MINWNDIHAAQKFAQERYLPLIEANAIERASQLVTSSRTSEHALTWRHRLGRVLVRWGHRLQQRDSTTMATSLCIEQPH